MIYEAVLWGHPDKLADIISDTVVDEMLSVDHMARVACEVLVSKQCIFVGGEIDNFDSHRIDGCIRDAVREVGYLTEDDGIDPNTMDIMYSVSKQSEHLRNISGQTNIACGDQSIVVGYASNEHYSMLPTEVFLGKVLAATLSDSSVPFRLPDGKVFICRSEVDDNHFDITISSQHSSGIGTTDFAGILDQKTRIILEGVQPGVSLSVEVNPPDGIFTFGGPKADAGLTGRKLVADGYGPLVPWGGGALSGKDPSKIDRVGAYAARSAARSLVVAGILSEATVTIAYMIGRSDPVALSVLENGQRSIEAEKALLDKADLSIGGTIERFSLQRPIFAASTKLYHFGVGRDLPWETEYEL